MREAAGPLAEPDVSVVIGAYNAMPYVVGCLASLERQTIERDRMEIVLVDDCSTDQTAAVFDEFAAAWTGRPVRVVHQPVNSGGPSRPRNTGLALATGRYVFFLDADDQFGDEALARMVAAADKYTSDVVYARPAGVNGRAVPRSMFGATQPRADLYSSRIYRTLSAWKMFRRALIERAGLTFPEDLAIGEDQVFTARALFNAETVTVLADYDYLHVRAREDGQNITRRLTDVPRRIRLAERVLSQVDEYHEPGPRRDHLTPRHLRDLSRAAFGRHFLTSDPAVQDEAIAATRRMLDRWYTPGAAADLDARVRVRFNLIARGERDRLLDFIRADVAGEHGPTIVEKGRAYAGFAAFRNPAFGVPDDCFDITDELAVHHHLDVLRWTDGVLHIGGQAYIDSLDQAAATTELILRERTSGDEYRLAAADREHPAGGFHACVDPATGADGRPLPTGVWDVHLGVSAEGVTRTARFGARRDTGVTGVAGVAASPATYLMRAGGDRTAVIAYFTKDYGNLTLDVGENIQRFVPRVRVESIGWTDGVAPALSLSGCLDEPIGEPAEIRVVATTANQPHTVEHSLGLSSATGHFEGTIAAQALRSRLTSLTIEVMIGGRTRPARVTWPAVIPRPRSWQGIRRYEALLPRSGRSQQRALTVEARPVTELLRRAPQALRRRLRRDVRR